MNTPATVLFLAAMASPLIAPLSAARPPSPIVDTGQVLCYDTLEPIKPPRSGHDYIGQDAQYQGVPASYTDNGDGTVTDQATGLT